MRKIIICGSISAADEIIKVMNKLELMGFEVEVPEGVKRKEIRDKLGDSDETRANIKIKYDLIRGYFEKMKNYDAVLVVNPEKKGINNYIGGNTLIEMAFAHILNKPLYVLYQIPEMQYTSEILATSPVALNGNLENINDYYVDVVDEKDNVLGRELKSKKSELNFISRVVAIIVRDSNKNIVVCKRGSHKKIDADKYDLSAFGNVNAGESYEQAAKRELMEETGIACPLISLGKFYQENEYNGRTLKIFCEVFLAESNEDPKLNHEVTSFRKISLEDLEKEIEKNPNSFCEGFRNDINMVKDKLRF